MSRPSVSIIIPTYHRESLLIRAVQSVAIQRGINAEIIIVNDSPRPLGQVTRNVVMQLGASIIEGHKTSKQALGYGSGGYARNIGLRAARGEFLALLDDDDEFLPGKLLTQMKVMESEGALICCSDAKIITYPRILHSLGYRQHSDHFKKTHRVKLASTGETIIPDWLTHTHLLSHNFVITSTVVLRQDLLSQFGYFSNLRNGGMLVDDALEYEDWEYWKRITAHGHAIRRISDATILYRYSLVNRLKNRLRRRGSSSR
jgi:glycosyltransferase involved in cell wall biosynthesis